MTLRSLTYLTHRIAALRQEGNVYSKDFVGRAFRQKGHVYSKDFGGHALRQEGNVYSKDFGGHALRQEGHVVLVLIEAFNSSKTHGPPDGGRTVH